LESYTAKIMSADAPRMFPMDIVVGIEFTYVAGRGGEGATLDSANDGLGDLTGGEHLVYGRCIGV
jgi:hypothetical protein